MGPAAVLLSAGCLAFGYLAVVAWRFPSDGPAAESMKRTMIERYPPATGQVLDRMSRLIDPVTRSGRARPLALASAAMGVLAIVLFTLA